MDLVLGLTATPRDVPPEQQFTGILVLTEYLSKYAMAFPIRQKSSDEIVPLLFRYIAVRFCIGSGPGNYQRGGHSFDVGDWRRAPGDISYHHRAKGAVERTNQILSSILSSAQAPLEPSEGTQNVPGADRSHCSSQHIGG